ncbi:MAG: NADH-quinone oxidoreductase subunit NuoF [Nitrospirae bacterium]|nr:NADH-quinone oxidoreductase subunit NuoF [Nitrospirota bacterium]
MSFDDVRRQAKEEWKALQDSQRPLILVGTATCGRSAGAAEVLETFQQELENRNLNGRTMEVGCLGLCYAEPVVCIIKPSRPGICYGNVTPEKAKELLESYLVNDDPRPDYALGTIGDGNIAGIPDLFQTPVLKPQVRRTLRNCGFIDPANAKHYLAHNGYNGFLKALRMSPEQIIAEIKKAGLRGRGGAGFPTWRKWQFCREAKGEEKYLICNADEGDPGAFMNRSLIEGDPHSLLEGMLIAGYAIGAREGYIYCRAEYPLALERLQTALRQAEEYGLLGENILESGFGFQIKVKEGAGAFVCGEETALIASIEGNRGMPRPRPPFPAVSGLWKKPTIINNVETLACVTLILQNGAGWFTQYGTEKSKGTKTFALVGKVNRTGLVEVPLGITLRQMIYEIGGGIPENKRLKAVQTGGPSGGCIPHNLLDIPVDYDSLKAAGTIMGSGGMVVMDENTCMVDFARYFLDFAQQESCGECVPCRLGTKQLLEILEDITRGKGKPEDIDLLVELAEAIKMGALCGLGQTAPNPVLTTIRYFRDEYEAHLKYKRCPAVVCKEIISSPCQHVCPISTEAATYISLIAEKRFREAFAIILKDNPLPSVCGRVCHHPCESKCQAGKWDRPIAIRALKRFVADYARQAGISLETEQRTGGEKVAIIGSGPAGLMAGRHLANKGYEVTIFEALDVPGGGLAVYIPEFRLPRDILNTDIENIKKAGVKIKTNTRIGKDIPFDELLNNYRAVFIAAGAHKSRKLHIPNEDTDGVMEAMEFLKNVNLKKKVLIGKKVGIIGGGNAAVDAARAAVRLKDCEKVLIIYRRTRTEMPAFAEEIEAALEEGVEIQFLRAPTKIITEKGKIAGVECVKMELGERDESGRRRPVPVAGSEFIINLDTLLVAIGEDPDLRFLGQGRDIEVSKRGTIAVDPETLVTNVAGVFAGGDIVTGPNTVIEAMSAGKIAAEGIDKYIRGESLAREYKLTRPSMYLPPVELTEQEIEEARRPAIPSLPVSERKNNFKEVDLNITEETAIKEARRCLRCDLETEDGKKQLEQKQR